ncbi:protein kinase [Streptomyces sp. SID2131]|nr:protein kinase [Streptomyces sp. SID2131]
MESGEVLNGRYELVERLDDSRAREVWAGRDLSHGREVAIKLLRRREGTGARTDLAARFKNEVERLAAVGEPHIAPLYDYRSDTTSDGPVEYVVSELVHGRTLAEETKDVLPPLPKVLSFTVQILLALRAAHSENIVHRDLHPANIMIEDSGHVKVLDFGVSLLNDTRFVEDLDAGIPVYLAPEQFTSGALDRGADVYALGCVMYEMLTGSTPFDRGLKRGQLQWSTVHDLPAPPSKFRPSVPAELDQLVLRLMATDPKDRPGSVEDVLNVLRRFTPEAASNSGKHDEDSARNGRHYTPQSVVDRIASDVYRDLHSGIIDMASVREMDPSLSIGLEFGSVEPAPSPLDPEPYEEDAASAAASLDEALARLFLRLGPPPELAEMEITSMGSDGGGAQG